MVVSPGYFLSSRRPRQNSTATLVVKQREHARGHCVGMGICHAWECSGTIHVGSQCSHWDLATRRHGIWACEGGDVVFGCCMSWWRAHRWSCLRCFVAASRRGGRAVVPGYSVLGGLITLKIWTHLSLYFCVVSVRVWGPKKVGLCTGSSPRKPCMLAEHLLIAHTFQVWLRVSQNISGVSIAQVSKKQTPVSTSQAQIVGCSFLSSGCLLHDFSNFSGRSIGNIDGGSDGQCEGCGEGTSAAP